MSFDDRTMRDDIINNINNDKFYNKFFVKFVKIPFYILLYIKYLNPNLIFLKFTLVPDLFLVPDLLLPTTEYYKDYMFVPVKRPIIWVDKNILYTIY